MKDNVSEEFDAFSLPEELQQHTSRWKLLNRVMQEMLCFMLLVCIIGTCELIIIFTITGICELNMILIIHSIFW